MTGRGDQGADALPRGISDPSQRRVGTHPDPPVQAARRLNVVLPDAIALGVSITESALSFRTALFGRFAVPELRFTSILIDTEADFVHEAETLLHVGVTQLGGFPIPPRCLGVVLPSTCTALILQS